MDYYQNIKSKYIFPFVFSFNHWSPNSFHALKLPKEEKKQNPIKQKKD